MALKWIIGDFATGNTSMTAAANQLPVVANSGDKINIDINAGESAVLTLSKNDIPVNWEGFLKPGYRFVALVDPELAWGSSVIWAGLINKFLSVVNDTIKIQATGLKEYLSMHIISNVYNSTNANPETIITFRGSTHQQLMANMIADCFSSTSVPSTAPKPPQILRSVIGTGTGTTFSHSVKLTDFQHYGPLIDLWRNELSDSGQEYRFIPSWDSSAMTRIRWTGEVASATLPHFNETTTYAINLNSDAWMPTAYSQSSSTDNMISRIIGQTKSGDGTAGSDYTTKTIASSTSILIDEAFNPGVELTTAQLNTQLTQRLNYNSQVYREANFERAYSSIPELRTIMSYLGAMATFTGSGASQYFGLTMRIVGLSFSPSKRIVEIQLAPKAARYPRLPKDNKTLKPNPGTVNTGPSGIGGTGGVGVPGDTRAPIVPPKKPGDNGTTPIPGGIPKPPEPIIPPPFQVPGDDYTDADSVISSSEVRLFKKPSTWVAENGGSYNNYIKKQISPNRARFNHNSGEYIGLNMPFQTLYMHTFSDTWDAPSLTSLVNSSGFIDLEVYSYDFNKLFEPHSGSPYQDMILQNVQPTSPIIGEQHKKLVGTIPQSIYSDLALLITDFLPQLPSAINRRRSTTRGAYDYNFFCSEDFQTLYIQIMYNISAWRVDSADNNKTKSWSYTSTKTLKGVRNSEGIVEIWEDLGNTFTTEDFTGSYIYYCPSIYEINGEFKGFGGYVIPQIEQGVEIKEVQDSTGRQYVPKLPSYLVKFYRPEIININLDDFYFNNSGINMNFSDFYGSGNVLSEFTTPYAVNIDYSREKIYIGVSRSNNNTSTFYESDFSYNFNKILETQKETSEIFIDPRGGAYGPIEDFKFSINPAIAYKNNYIVINSEGSYKSASGTVDEKRGLRYTRSKKGFTDSVSGILKFIDIPSGQTGYNHSVKELLRLFNWNINNGNKLGAFYSYNSTSQLDGYTSQAPMLDSGFGYFVYNQKMYIIANNYFDEGYYGSLKLSPTQFNNLEKTSFWIGEFEFDDTKL